MIQTHIADDAGFDLQFLYICLIQNLESCLYFVWSKHASPVEKLNRLRLIEYLVCFRHVSHSSEATRSSFYLPLLAVTVTLEHDIL